MGDKQTKNYSSEIHSLLVKALAFMQWFSLRNSPQVFSTSALDPFDILTCGRDGNFDDAMDDVENSTRAALFSSNSDDEDEELAWRLLFYDEEEEETEDFVPRSRRPSKNRNFDAGLEQIRKDYFNDDCAYDDKGK